MAYTRLISSHIFEEICLELPMSETWWFSAVSPGYLKHIFPEVVGWQVSTAIPKNRDNLNRFSFSIFFVKGDIL